jgi:hypothetical protein
MKVSREFEFNNRIAAQRRLLRTVNKSDCWSEQLAGISVDAIERFACVNSLPASDDLVRTLRLAAKALQCLATKSQEQLTDEYDKIEIEVDELQRSLEILLANMAMHSSQDSSDS